MFQPYQKHQGCQILRPSLGHHAILTSLVTHKTLFDQTPKPVQEETPIHQLFHPFSPFLDCQLVNITCILRQSHCTELGKHKEGAYKKY